MYRVRMSQFTYIFMQLQMNNHWALLVANVADRTVSMADSVPSRASAQFVVDFKHYMARRADVTQELQHN